MPVHHGRFSEVQIHDQRNIFRIVPDAKRFPARFPRPGALRHSKNRFRLAVPVQPIRPLQAVCVNAAFTKAVANAAKREIHPQSRGDVPILLRLFEAPRRERGTCPLRRGKGQRRVPIELPSRRLPCRQGDALHCRRVSRVDRFPEVHPIRRPQQIAMGGDDEAHGQRRQGKRQKHAALHVSPSISSMVFATRSAR